ncbi:unnamed protein product [Tenebrio molitor]|nr:unnamed protein product [Tenebrio molitor]
MLQLIYTLKRHNNRWFSTPSKPRISFERPIQKKNLFGIFKRIKCS